MAQGVKALVARTEDGVFILHDFFMISYAIPIQSKHGFKVNFNNQ